MNCVAEFIFYAINELTTKIADSYSIETALSRALNRSGAYLVSQADALNVVPGILYPFNLTLSVRPFTQIPFRDFEGAYLDIQARGGCLAVGLAWNILLDTPGDNFHVVRCGEASGEYIELLDKVFPAGRQNFHWERVERAVLASDSGFWHIHKKEHT